jgi:hypothetical protein
VGKVKPPLFTTPEIRKALDGADELTRMSALRMVNLWTHLAKTGFSFQTHARNFLSGTMMNVAQGHLPFTPSVLGQSKRAALDYGVRRLDITNVEAKAAYQTLIKKNLLGKGTRQGDLEHYLQLADHWLTKAGKSGTGILGVNNKLLTAYQGEDDFWKVYLYLKEFKRYKKALPDLPVKQIEEMSANIVRDTMQIYSRIPRAVRRARDFPITGPFVSFPSEIVRNLKNTTKIAIREMRDPNPAMKNIGAQRMAGLMAATMGVPYALKTTGRYLVGWGDEAGNIQEASQVGDTAKESALRVLMAPYDAEGQFIPIAYDEKEGTYTYLNFSFMDPYNYPKKAILAALRLAGRDDYRDEEKLETVFKEAADPFINPEITVSEFLKLNETLHRRSEAPLAYKAGEVVKRGWKALAPAMLSSQAERILRSAEVPGIKEWLPSKYKYGQELNLPAELTALMGPRITTMRVDRAFKYRAGTFSRAITQAQQIVSEESGAHFRSPVLQIRAQENAQKTIEQAGVRILREIAAARELGRKDYQIDDIMKAAGIRESYRDELLSGRIPQVEFKVRY